MKRLLAISIIVIALLSIASLADKPDRSEGAPNVGDRVIYFSDFNGDGFFERNVGVVADDVPTTARLNGQPVTPGQKVNLWVFPSASTPQGDNSIVLQPAPYLLYNVPRGRFAGHYESLQTSNH